MGDLSRWRVFALGGNLNQNNVEAAANAFVQGDVGVAGAGNIKLTGTSLIRGDIWFRSNGNLLMSGGSHVTGSFFHNAAYDPQLDNGVNEAINTSNQAWALPVTPAYAGITNIQLTNHQNLTLSGAPGQTVVLKLNNFQITSGTLTLMGTATTNFVINVSKQFSLSSSAEVKLTGGVVAQNVLFNVRGTGTNVTLSNTAILRGYVLATNRTVSMAGLSIVRGGVWANQVLLNGGAQVVSP